MTPEKKLLFYFVIYLIFIFFTKLWIEKKKKTFLRKVYLGRNDKLNVKLPSNPTTYYSVLLFYMKDLFSVRDIGLL